MSKCDFRVSLEQMSGDPEWRLVLGSLKASGLQRRFGKLEGQVPRGDLRVAADKCDWSVKMLQDRIKNFKQPTVTAAMSSAKADFRIRLDFGLDKGRIFRIGAVSSSKCDFHIEDFRSFDPASRTWKKAETGTPAPPALKKRRGAHAKARAARKRKR
jgi:hypothetical protein